ncbi:MAG: LPP20 family lipoprotein [Schwartzia sp.]|nr:LPP20 family lipoprotein [Schwartzia sp. (in: firmicutes)]
MKQRILGLLTACLLLMCSVAFAAGADFEANRVEAEGFGLPPAYAVSEAQSRLLARRAAISDAQRNLAEQIAGVQVDSETTVQNLQIANDTIRTRVSALLKGAKVISESYEDGAYRVVMALPLYGASNSLASAVLPQLPRRESFPTSIAPEPDKPLYTPTQPETTTVTTTTTRTTTIINRQSGTYTGIIVDCTGLGLRSAMSPVIKTTAGEPIYGYKNLDSKKVIKNGMAGYATRFDGNVARAGSNPLVVKAVGVDHYFNPVVNVADAKIILEENELTHFLDNCAVVFIK